MNKDEAVIYLNLIAAKAKQLANAADKNQLWNGDLKNGLNEISKALEAAYRAERAQP